MGALSGGMTIKRMIVESAPPKGHRERYIESLAAYAIRPISPEDEEDRTAGWAAISHPLDTRFDIEKVFFNEYLCVAYRVDTLRVPSSTLKLYQREAELSWLADNHRETMPRGERKSLYEQVQRDLRAKILPTIKAIDLVWNTQTGQVFIWSHSPRILEEISELFQKTFDLGLLPCDPYCLGQRELDEELAPSLDAAEPAVFFDAADE